MVNFRALAHQGNPSVFQIAFHPKGQAQAIIALPLLQELFPATRRTFQCELADVTAKGRRGLIFSNECPCGSSKSTRDSERSSLSQSEQEKSMATAEVI